MQHATATSTAMPVDHRWPLAWSTPECHCSACHLPLAVSPATDNEVRTTVRSAA